MSKAFLVTANEKNGIARIEIIGNIYEWNENNAGGFRSKVNELVRMGISDAHIYINSGGGDCFQANEIENILRSFKGNITGEGGALVASAATYLAVKIDNFVLAENCQFMIHKPRIQTDGTEKEIENNLRLLKNLTEQYKRAYLSKTSMPEAVFLEKWENGDFWMTSQEAKDNGFVSGISGAVTVDEGTAQMIRACGGSLRSYSTPPVQRSTPIHGYSSGSYTPPPVQVSSFGNQFQGKKWEDLTKDELEYLHANDIETCARLYKERFGIELNRNRLYGASSFGSYTPPPAQVSSFGSQFQGKKWEDLTKDELEYLHANDIEKFAKLYKERYGREYKR